MTAAEHGDGAAERGARAPRWLAPSMPVASPLVIVKPRSLKYRANCSAVSRPSVVGLRLPTIASCGAASSASSGPSTQSASGASAISREARRIRGAAERDERAVRQREPRAPASMIASLSAIVELRDRVGCDADAREACAATRRRALQPSRSASARRARVAWRLAAPPGAASARRLVAMAAPAAAPVEFSSTGCGRRRATRSASWLP